MNSYTDLAAAIRKGAAVRPQTRLVYFWKEPGSPLCSCVLGAAYEGATGRTDGWIALGDIQSNFRGVDWETAIQCPACEDVDCLAAIMGDLNDTHQWTRHAIADWLDTLAAPERRAATPQERH